MTNRFMMSVAAAALIAGPVSRMRNAEVEEHELG
jgi:hypothetical protein